MEYILSETLFEEEDEPIQVNIIDKDIAAIGNLMLSEEINIREPWRR
ncbi:MAG: hypothetical protein ACLRMX_03420 [Lachnospira eligens]